MIAGVRAARADFVPSVQEWGSRLVSQLARHALRPLTRIAREGGIAVALVLVLLVSFLTPLADAHAGLSKGVATPVHHAKNVFHPQPDLGGHAHVAPAAAGVRHVEQQAPPVRAMARSLGVTMRAAALALNAGPAHLVGSDGLLEVRVPAGAVTPAIVTRAGGSLKLLVTQLAGGSGSTNSGQVSLGTYQFELVGPHGPVSGGLAHPISVTLHYAPWAHAGYDLTASRFILNGGAIPASAAAPTAGGGQKPTVLRPTIDRAHQTLTVILPASASGGGTTVGTWNTNSPEAQWSKPADTAVDLNAGGLTYDYPLDLPPGPGGFTPPLHLSYSSAAVDENHNPQAAAGWVGEGWDLSLGAITWSEENVNSSCTIFTCTQANCGQNLTCAEFENVWSFSDPFGNGGDLIPPDTNVSTYYDDTTNPLPTNTDYIWHTAPESRIKIVSFSHANVNWPAQNYAVNPPCFRVWLTNGVMEEFGCTADSLQYYVSEGAASSTYKFNLPYRWDLDMIVDPNGNQIHITYDQTMVNDPGVVGAAPFPIDAVPATITYDSPPCNSTTTLCTGTSWEPLVKVTFATDTAPSRFYPAGQTCLTFTWRSIPSRERRRRSRCAATTRKT